MADKKALCQGEQVAVLLSRWYIMVSYDGWHLRSQHRFHAQVPTARFVCSESEFLYFPEQIMNLLPFPPRFIALSSCELRKQVVVHSLEGRLGNEVDFRVRLFCSRSSSAGISSKMLQHSFSTTLNTLWSVLTPSLFCKCQGVMEKR